MGAKQSEGVGRIDFRQQGSWIRGLEIRTPGELEAMLTASTELARACGMDSMRVVATPPGERPFVGRRAGSALPASKHRRLGARRHGAPG